MKCCCLVTLLVGVLYRSVGADECYLFDVTVTVDNHKNYIGMDAELHCGYQVDIVSSVLWSVKLSASSSFVPVYYDVPTTEAHYGSKGSFPDFKDRADGYFPNKQLHVLVLPKVHEDFHNSLWKCNVTTPLRCLTGIESKNNGTLKIKQPSLTGPWLEDAGGKALVPGSVLPLNAMMICYAEAEPQATMHMFGTSLGGEHYDTVCDKINDTDRFRCARWARFTQPGGVSCWAEMMGEEYHYCPDTDCKELHIETKTTQTENTVKEGSPSSKAPILIPHLSVVVMSLLYLLGV